MANRCDHCRKFVSAGTSRCASCVDMARVEANRAARIAAIPIPPWCAWPFEPCICGDTRAVEEESRR